MIGLRVRGHRFPDGRTSRVVCARLEVAPEALAAALDLRPPCAVLLSIGGAGSMSATTARRLAPVFGVLGAGLAQKGVTVLDGGTEAGVIGLMGGALAAADRTAPYIGVVPARARVGAGGKRARDILERNHSHLVLLDSDQWGAEVELMGDLAGYLAGTAPRVAFLANGGEIALREVEASVRRDCEVVVLRGSGRLADEIADALLSRRRPIRERIQVLLESGRLTLLEASSQDTSALLAMLDSRFSQG